MSTDAPRLCRVAGRDTWHIYHRRRRVSTGHERRAEAELVLSEYIRGLSRVQTPISAAADILARYLANRRERGIPGLARLEYAHKPLVRILGMRPPEAIGETETHAYAARRGREGVSTATVRTELQALSAALKWAAGERIITAAPTIKLPARPEGRIRWLTREEAGRLVDACHAPHVRLFVLIALHTGARSGAILSLTWERVDMDARVIDFRVPGAERTRKRRVQAPINDTLFAALSAARGLAASESVIEWAGGGIARIVRGFRESAARAGLKGVTPHVLRHTAVTWLLQAGIPVWTVAGYVGMTAEMVDQVYGHHHTGQMRDAARALG